jgi:mono/diheme cytochrome c family protein
MVARTLPLAGLAAAAVLALAAAPWARQSDAGVSAARDGHARPRALAFNADDGLLYAALSTQDQVAVVDPRGPRPRMVARVASCRFPGAVAALPGGGALVACRFEPALRRVSRAAEGRWASVTVPAGSESGARGLALAPDGRVAYVSSPAVAGVKVVSLAGDGVVQTLPTGLSPRALRVVPAGALPGQPRALLLVSSFLDRRVTAHPIAADGRLGAAVQTIQTEAPVLDLLVSAAPPALWLLTHEDRPLSRPTGPVQGLDSAVLVLRARPAAPGEGPFLDPGPGRRSSIDTSDRAPEPVVELAAAALDARTGAIALVGAGTDNLLVAPAGALGAARAVGVGVAPAAVAALPGGRWVTADRLSDTLTFVDAAAGHPRASATLDLGGRARLTPAELGEVMFYSRALTPRNVATGPLSLYTCAACHDDGHVDGRRHPSKRNRFLSMTKTCRGLGTTAPYLSLGEPTTIEAFADNIVATHAQGADLAPEDYDRYPVTLRLRDGEAWKERVLSPDEVRAALAAYMAAIPVEPSPFVSPGQRALTAPQRRGLAVFRDGCAGCHQLVGDTTRGEAISKPALERRLLSGGVALASPRLYDVGTPVLGKTGNNPPSLRGVWEAAPYFSDGSARTLEDVIARTDPDAEKVHAPANAERPPAFDEEARAALLAFLRAL